MASKKTVQVKGVNYQIKTQLAQGGAGTVFHVETDDGIECALKRINVSADFVEAEREEREPKDDRETRFLREIQYCLQDHSPRIIKISGYDVCESPKGACIYYVMPLYSDTLHSVMKVGVDVDQAFRYSEQLLEALAVVHSDGVTHRDIKPDNILIDKDQNLVLADFGTAHFKALPMLTKKQDLLANRDYLAPEQRKGKDARDVNQAADIFAAGLIINELFTSVRPNGPEFDLVYDAYPRLFEVDELISMMTQISPDSRIDANQSLAYLRRIVSKDKELRTDVQDAFEHSSPDVPERLVEQAVEDVLDGFTLLSRGSLDDSGRFNLNFHCNISYSVRPELKNLCFLLKLLEKCRGKFLYEAVTCRNEGWFEEEREIRRATKEQCEKLDGILNGYKYSNNSNNFKLLEGEIRKYFLNLRDYHCEEILDVENLVEEIEYYLIDSPILYVCYYLQEMGFLQNRGRDYIFDIDVFTFVAYLEILESRSKVIEEYSGIFPAEQLEELTARDFEAPFNTRVLGAFQEEWPDVQVIPRVGYFSAIFSSYEAYLSFRKKSLAEAENDYCFEGDVLDMLKPLFLSFDGGVVELKFDRFVIRQVIARLLNIEK